MSFADVKNLRQSGRLDEALTMALHDLDANPNDIWNKRALFWVLYEYLKKAAGQADDQLFLEYIRQISELKILNLPDESIARINVFRCIRTLLKNMSSGKNIPATVKAADILCEFSLSVEMPKPSAEYSTMLDAFLPVNEVWPGFVTFVERWDFDHFMPEDLKERTIEKSGGRPMSYMSLAECAYLAYTKAILRNKDTERAKAFQPKLDRMAENTSMSYLGYYNAQLLLFLNADDQDVLKEVLPFARKKKNEFWIWQFLSEVFDDDEEKYLACLLRASHCRTKEDFLPKIRVKLACFYYQRGDFPRLKYQVDQYIRCRLAHGYGISGTIQQMMRDGRFELAQSDSSDPIEYMKITNEIIGHRSNSSDVQSGREIDGVVTSNKSGSAFFVRTGKEFVYIPAELARKVSVGDKVKAVAVESYDKKRQEKGWKCIEINKL